MINKETNVHTGSHRVNIVELIDKKYNISGLYHADACWDSILDEQSSMTLNYCLLTFNDIKLLSRINIHSKADSNYLYLYSDDKPSGILYNCNTKTLEFLKTLKLMDINQERKHFVETILHCM